MFGGQHRTDLILSEECFSSDLITCDLAYNKGVWKIHNPPGIPFIKEIGEKPPSRKQSSFLFDEKRSRILLFGGSASKARPGKFVITFRHFYLIDKSSNIPSDKGCTKSSNNVRRYRIDRRR